MGKARILLVEDEFIVAESIRNVLRNLGYHVIGHVPTGEEAIEKVDKSRPDLVLMDIVLAGDIDGVEAAGEINKRFDIPVVYLSAHSEKSFMERAKITEPFGYLLKPFQTRELRSTIEMALYKHKQDGKLKVSERKNRIIVDAIPDSVFEFKKDGTFALFKFKVENNSLQKESFTGKKTSDFFPANIAEMTMDYIQRALELKHA